MNQTVPGRYIPGRKEGKTMTKYDVKVIDKETGLMHTLEGRWESVDAMKEDLLKDGYIVIGYWKSFNQEG